MIAREMKRLKAIKEYNDNAKISIGQTQQNNVDNSKKVSIQSQLLGNQSPTIATLTNIP